MNTPASINRARRLRQSANFPERLAWETLRRLRDEGLAVRRQVPIEGVTVDFAIRSVRLVIEIDGAIHDEAEVREKDALRDQRLMAAGWRVLRIPAEITKSPDLLIETVRAEIERLKKATSP